MKTIHMLAMTTLAAAMAAGTAFAQQPTTPPPASPPQAAMEARDHDKKPRYDELNVRGDGRVTRADLSAHPKLLENFDEIDTDGDGTISSDEYEAWKSQKRDRGDSRSDY